MIPIRPRNWSMNGNRSRPDDFFFGGVLSAAGLAAISVGPPPMPLPPRVSARSDVREAAAERRLPCADETAPDSGMHDRGQTRTESGGGSPVVTKVEPPTGFLRSLAAGRAPRARAGSGSRRDPPASGRAHAPSAGAPRRSARTRRAPPRGAHGPSASDGRSDAAISSSLSASGRRPWARSSNANCDIASTSSGARARIASNSRRAASAESARASVSARKRRIGADVGSSRSARRTRSAASPLRPARSRICPAKSEGAISSGAIRCIASSDAMADSIRSGSARPMNSPMKSRSRALGSNGRA